LKTTWTNFCLTDVVLARLRGLLLFDFAENALFLAKKNQLTKTEFSVGVYLLQFALDFDNFARLDTLTLF